MTPTPVTETATPAIDATPTPKSEAATATDQERIDAAVAQLDAEVAVGEGPSNTFAYDLLDSKIDDEGNVTLTICVWTGDTVFDTVRDSLYRTSVDAEGVVTASHITTPIATGDCLNTQVIESALDFIDEFSTYWADITADPQTFASDDPTRPLMTDEYQLLAESLADRWLADDVYFEDSFEAGDIRQTATADILYRRYKANDLEILEVVVCRTMNPDYGTYRDGLLIDDNREEGSPGLHAVDAYQFVAQDAQLGELELAGSDALIWSDCFATGDWPGAANVWRSRDTPLEVLAK